MTTFLPSIVLFLIHNLKKVVHTLGKTLSAFIQRGLWNWIVPVNLNSLFLPNLILQLHWVKHSTILFKHDCEIELGKSGEFFIQCTCEFKILNWDMLSKQFIKKWIFKQNYLQIFFKLLKQFEDQFMLRYVAFICSQPKLIYGFGLIVNVQISKLCIPNE